MHMPTCTVFFGLSLNCEVEQSISSSACIHSLSLSSSVPQPGMLHRDLTSALWLTGGPTEAQHCNSISGNTDISNPWLLKAQRLPSLCVWQLNRCEIQNKNTPLLFTLKLLSNNTEGQFILRMLHSVGELRHALWTHNGHIILRQVAYLTRGRLSNTVGQQCIHIHECVFPSGD